MKRSAVLHGYPSNLPPSKETAMCNVKNVPDWARDPLAAMVAHPLDQGR